MTFFFLPVSSSVVVVGGEAEEDGGAVGSVGSASGDVIGDVPMLDPSD